MKTVLSAKCELYNFEKLFKEKGYAWFTSGDYNLNIVGIRSAKDKTIVNKFDDVLIVDYTCKTGHKRMIYNITTKPGLFYMNNPVDIKGAAILVPGQYRGCWKLGLHKGKYQALVQVKPVSVFRDNNKDNKFDLIPETIDKGIFGLNIHRSNEGFTPSSVDKYSAGCQVFASPNDYNSFIRLCKEQIKLFGNSFTYTLINEEDLI